MASNNPNFSSPTESEFSDCIDDPDSAKNWDEERVCDWLHTVNCGLYEKLFRKNNINGENLLEMDKAVLQEMGIDKIGDRVRLFLAIKKLRTKAYANQKKRNRVSSISLVRLCTHHLDRQDSFAGLDPVQLNYTPSSSGSPRPPNSGGRAAPLGNKRFSRQYDGHNTATAIPDNVSKSPSRPNSPLAGSEGQVRAVRQQRHGVLSPAENARRDQAQGYFGASTSAASIARRPGTPSDMQPPPTARLITHTRGQGSIDGSLMASLPQDQDVIRVISASSTKVVKIAGCKSCDEVMRLTLRKFGYREDHDRNYCFYSLAGLEPDPSACRRLYEPELWRIVSDPKRPERNRLILRKIHAGEPGPAELQRAADIAMEEAQAIHSRALESAGNKRSQMKVSKVLGESWDTNLQHPLSPASFQSAGERERNVYNTAKDLERPPSRDARDRPIPRKQPDPMIRPFFGQRPPSELITSDLTTYFPGHPREEIDRTARLSLRRSRRLSRANSRLSVASNLSFASSIRDAPPIPTIADTWLQGNHQFARVRALDVGRGQAAYRDSIASSMLEPLQEESPVEPNRKSYVSFTNDSGSDTANVSVTDPDGNTMVGSYFDEGSTEISGGSMRELSQALNEDGEDDDADLQSFLAGDSWDDSKWMKGALIGQGSFGSVYLALHAITGELLAVKQVEAPSQAQITQMTPRRRA